METLPKKAIVDTIEATEEYNARLDGLLQSAESAESQVQQSAQNAAQQIETVFDQLKLAINNALAERKASLLASTDRLSKESLVPLTKCRVEILNRRTSSVSLISDAKNVLKIGGFKSEEMFSNFIQKSSTMGNLPAVPEPELVPEITFQGDTKEILAEITAAISTFGQVSKIGPVQISSVDPHPGSLLLRWEDIDSDSLAEVQSYKLQMATGNAWKSKSPENSIFHDVYVGPEACHLVRDIRPFDEYCFRVSCKFSGSDWSAWSCVKTASTDQPPFQWETTNPSYRLSNDNKLARPLTPDSILFSHLPQIKSGHSILFSLTKSGVLKADEGVALCSKNKLPSASLCQNGTLFVSFMGEIFVDGKKKTINLPEMGNRDNICFGCEVVKGKWRVTIERGTKAVTYDWAVDSDALYFSTLLSDTNSLLLVQ